jgi:hypothetical protein
MKKVLTSKDWKSQSRRRQADEEKRKRRRKIYLAHKRRLQEGLSPAKRWEVIERGKTKTIKVPSNFSFINNTLGILHFFDQMRTAYLKKRRVFVDLSEIEELTPDAIIALLSKMDDRNFISRQVVSGNTPRNTNLRNIFTQSGFFDYVKAYDKPLKSGDSLILPEKSRRVESDTADELVRFVTKKLFGAHRRCHGIQATLVECMTNTHNHAAPVGPHKEKWWSAVYYDRVADKAQFIFVDNGVGIFESAEMGPVLKAARYLQYGSNADVLREMLKGNVQSRTKLSYRGKGLPAIYKALMRGQLKDLIIISNDVYAKVADDDYQKLTRPFNGTFFYWEMPGNSNGKSSAQRR